MTETVTVRNPEVCSAEFEGASEPTPSTGERAETLKSEVTVRDRVRDVLVASRAYWTPPEILTKRPPTVAALAAYARRGAWTRDLDGPIRRAGVWWFRLVGVPVTVMCRFAEWVWQRPGRALTASTLFVLFAHTTPGRWLVDAVSAVVGVLAWALL